MMFAFTLSPATQQRIIQNRESSQTCPTPMPQTLELIMQTDLFAEQVTGKD